MDSGSWCDGRMCDHQGFHTAEGRYDASSHTLRYVVVCDTCRIVVRELSVESYAPRFDPRGNDAHLSAA
jgi:hypothetical protein